jgi:hypothetical protein
VHTLLESRACLVAHRPVGDDVVVREARWRQPQFSRQSCAMTTTVPGGTRCPLPTDCLTIVGSGWREPLLPHAAPGFQRAVDSPG